MALISLSTAGFAEEGAFEREKATQAEWDSHVEDVTKRVQERLTKKYSIGKWYAGPKAEDVVNGEALKFHDVLVVRVDRPPGGQPNRYEVGAEITYSQKDKTTTVRYQAIFGRAENGELSPEEYHTREPSPSAITTTDPLKGLRGNAKVKKAVNNRQVFVGMPEKALLASWGEPQSVNGTTTKSGKSKQYVFGDGQYVYVDGGLVTAIQNPQ